MPSVRRMATATRVPRPLRTGKEGAAPPGIQKPDAVAASRTWDGRRIPDRRLAATPDRSCRAACLAWTSCAVSLPKTRISASNARYGALLRTVGEVGVSVRIPWR